MSNTLYAEKGPAALASSLRLSIMAQLASFKLSVDTSAAGAKSAAKKLSPTGKLPVLSTRGGVVFGANAIAKHIARCNPGAGLYGFSPEESAQVDQWTSLCTEKLEVPSMVWHEFKADAKDKRAAFAQADMLAFLDIVDKKLQSSTYVVGNRLTAADVAILCACQLVVDAVLPPSPAMPNLRRWLACCSGEPAIAASFAPGAIADADDESPRDGSSVVSALCAAAASSSLAAAEAASGALAEAVSSSAKAGGMAGGITLPRDVPSRVQRLRLKTVLHSGVAGDGTGFIGKTVTVSGWAKSCRIGKVTSFIELADGSSGRALQIVLDENTEGGKEVSAVATKVSFLSLSLFLPYSLSLPPSHPPSLPPSHPPSLPPFLPPSRLPPNTLPPNTLLSLAHFLVSPSTPPCASRARLSRARREARR